MINYSYFYFLNMKLKMEKNLPTFSLDKRLLLCLIYEKLEKLCSLRVAPVSLKNFIEYSFQVEPEYVDIDKWV